MPLSNQPSRTPGKIESLLAKIPGFGGYLDRENRRENDAMLRDRIATLLQRSKRGIDDAARSLTNAGQLDALMPLERLRGHIDKLTGRINGAMAGYSSFFDPVQVDATMLDRVYDLDLGLLEHVADFAANVEKLGSASPDSSTTAATLLTDCDELDRRWNQREDLLKRGTTI